MTMKDIGSLISKLRNERGMSQEELATELNCTKQAVSNYERNTRKPDYEVLEAISDIFNVPIGFFLSEQERRAKLEQIYKTYNILGGDLLTDTSQITEDDELWELRETLRRNPNMRVLFSTAKNATPKQVKQAIAVLEALKASDDME